MWELVCVVLVFLCSAAFVPTCLRAHGEFMVTGQEILWLHWLKRVVLTRRVFRYALEPVSRREDAPFTEL